ncbi:universal stress protein [Halobacterium sp. KA-6]|jgi:nucleotide-binding universal stress UspA family protein|uniref:universal stress protein n=1 Tax=Halobacterium sp. KA-6 TaxID=2896368 RepID=UPI001E57B0EA|nr:universal stress protein [Halobacterium sp. KA-6]MCD2204963.1 universal stress protein [Halobacterium sp. KA-6]
MYRVLVPVDDDVDRALAQARYVANLPDAAESVEAIVLFVFTGDSEDLPEDVQQFKSASRIQSVRRAQEFLEDAGVDVQVRDDSGDTTDDIIAEADEYDVDAIVLGGRKRSPAGKAIFGSVTQSVILNADRPVVVTGEEA